MRAAYPEVEGVIDRDGVAIAYEVYGHGHSPTVVLVPTWCIFHSRSWKMQIPFLSRRYRVVTYDPRGNGSSDRPVGREQYSWQHNVEDLLGVLDATGTEQAVLVGLSMSGYWAALTAVLHPERVLGVVSIAPGTGLGIGHEDRMRYSYTDELPTTEGWAKENMHFIRRHYRTYVEFFVSQIFTEPHSTKPIEDGVRWALETDAETLIASDLADLRPAEDMAAFYRRMDRPMLIVQGDDDHIVAPASSRELARLTGADLVVLEGSGHAPNVRDPVKVNLLIEDFVERVARGPEPDAGPADGRSVSPPDPSLLWVRGLSRPVKALYLSSPIGLGHARRDVAIAKELKRRRPDIQIDWLAQHPVTTVLEAEGEIVHPASDWLASESAHIAEESTGHSLHCFQAIRTMDEILLANFMIFQEVIEEGLYDLVIGDEAWDVDHYWHENPELKRGAHAWLTDFVGYLPMPEGGDHEAFLTADYNAEMIEHIARFPRVRDRAIFVGGPDDVVPEVFGPGLPKIRDWTEEHFDFCGYITGFSPPTPDEVAELRDELGFAEDEKVCIVSVGGSGVGRDLLESTIAAYPIAKRVVPELRMIAVAGPRIDPNSLPTHPGLEVRGYVDRLYRHFSVCDLAVVQGGLTTTMELTAAKRPFLYFPLRNHFEQNRHVRHRLDQYGAGRHMEYAATDPDALAAAIVSEVGRTVAYRDVETDGATRAASLIADLI